MKSKVIIGIVLLLAVTFFSLGLQSVSAPQIPITPIDKTIIVVSNETFVLAYKMEWNEPDSLDYLNYFLVTVYWDCDDTTPHLNFTYIDYVCKYTNGSDVPLSGWDLEKRIPAGSTTPRYILSHYQYDGVWGNGEFWLNVTMRAAGVVGGSYTPHIGGDQTITISKVRCNEESLSDVGPGDATIRVVPRILCCDSTGQPKEVFNVTLGEAVYVKGHGFGSDVAMRLYVVENATWIENQTWTKGDDVRGVFNVTYADSGGNLAVYRLGLLPLGDYDIVADVYPFEKYNNATDAVDDLSSAPGVTVTGDTTPPVADAGSDQSIFQGMTVTFNGSGSTDNVGIVSYVWTFMDITPQTLTGINPNYTFNNVGNFEVTLKVTDAAGNWAIDTMWVYAAEDAIEPSISAPSHDPFIPDEWENVTVSVNVTDAESGLREVILSYSTDEGVTWINVTMNKVTGDTYEAEIRGFSAGTNVWYMIRAHDKANNTAVEDNAQAYYIYTVIPEFLTWTSILLIFILLTVATTIYKRRLIKTPIH